MREHSVSFPTKGISPYFGGLDPVRHRSSRQDLGPWEHNRGGHSGSATKLLPSLEKSQRTVLKVTAAARVTLTSRQPFCSPRRSYSHRGSGTHTRSCAVAARKVFGVVDLCENFSRGPSDPLVQISPSWASFVRESERSIHRHLSCFLGPLTRVPLSLLASLLVCPNLV